MVPTPHTERIRRASRHIPHLALWLTLLALLAGLAACAARVPGFPPGTLVEDVRRLPQDPAFYVAADTTLAKASALTPLPPERQAALAQRYVTRLLSPWNQNATSLKPEEAFWGVASYGNKQGYGENIQPRPKEWTQERVADMNREAFPSLAAKAVTLRNTVLRVMPTHRPFFYDFREAGEGYPFDYFQNSAVWAGTPVFVSHASRDGAWVFVETAFASGWTPSEDVAWMDDAALARWRAGLGVTTKTDASDSSGVSTATGAAILHDNVALRDASGRFLATVHVGAVLPLASPTATSTDTDGLTVLFPVPDLAGKAALVTARLPTNAATRLPLPLSAANVASVASRLAGQSYGWGGMYEDRDCSALMRDLFAPFGIWLPRNSGPQGKQGRVVDVSALPDAAKERAIVEGAVPFRTLLGMRGHIMLYLGTYQGRAVIFHDIWGVRTLDRQKREGRLVIGKAAITTLTPGDEFEDVRRAKKSLLSRIQTMAILGEESAGK